MHGSIELCGRSQRQLAEFLVTVKMHATDVIEHSFTLMQFERKLRVASEVFQRSHPDTITAVKI